MLSGLQVECGECDKLPTTTTTDEQTNDNSEKSEPPIAETKVTQVNEDRQVFVITCTACDETNTVSEYEAAEAFTTGATICSKCKSPPTTSTTVKQTNGTND